MITLEDSYRRCRELNRRHGTTYYWSTKLLPKAERPHVHALYAFCRHADDIVDDLGPASVAIRTTALAAFGERFFVDLVTGYSDDPILRAVIDTVERYGIEPECFRRFLRSMDMDLTIDSYRSFDDLALYMDGSAAVIGEMMLPILYAPAGGLVPPAAVGAARDLGIAFQLTNFLRDVAEDLDRGRVYLPGEDLERADATAALWTRSVTPQWRVFMADQIARARAYYLSAEDGLALLPGASARCVAGARTLYAGILTRIEAADYDVFTTRVRVPTWRKVAVAARALRP